MLILYTFIALIILAYHYMGLGWAIAACAALGVLHFCISFCINVAIEIFKRIGEEVSKPHPFTR